jgi:hypothetical protein
MGSRTIGLALALAALAAAPAAQADAPTIGEVSVVTNAVDHFAVEAPVDSNGADTSVHLEFGRTRALGGKTTSGTVAATDSTSPMTFEVDNLQANTTYYYRVVATNPDGTTTTPIAALQTPARTHARVLRGTTVQFAISTGSQGAYPWRILALVLPQGVPRGTRVNVICRRGCHGGGSAVSGPGRRQLKFRTGLRITRASILEVRETLKGYIGRIRRFVFRRSGSLLQAFRTMNRCLSAGKIVACPKSA